MEEIESDSHWITLRKGNAKQGLTGKRFTKVWGASRRRIVRYSPIVGGSAYSYPLYDIRRAEQCYSDHWSTGKRIRIFTQTRVVTGAVDDDEIFEGVLIGESFDPIYANGENKDWWRVTLEMRKYET
jgi:hypothetical protein